MSGFVVNENIKRFPKIMNFIEFTTLSESIEPVAIAYGTDYYNKEWNVYNEFKCTFYTYKNRSYCVVIAGDNVGFMTADHIVSIEKIHELSDIDDFGFDRVRVSEACRTFNHFFYIIYNICFYTIYNFKIERFSALLVIQFFFRASAEFLSFATKGRLFFPCPPPQCTLPFRPASSALLPR